MQDVFNEQKHLEFSSEIDPEEKKFPLENFQLNENRNISNNITMTNCI